MPATAPISNGSRRRATATSKPSASRRCRRSHRAGSSPKRASAIIARWLRDGIRGVARRAVRARARGADPGGQRHRRKDPIAARAARTHPCPRPECRRKSLRMKRAVIVICDRLRADLITPSDAPFLSESGRRPLPAEEGLGISKGDAGDTVATERFCEEVLRGRAPAIALLWLSEPDYTGHHTPLGSPAHRRAITSADENVRRVAETVASLDPTGENILFVVGSDHGMETVAETIDLDGLLIEAGLKAAPRSSEVVVAPNGTAALLYFADPAGALVGQVARFLETQEWVGRTFVGPGLATAGLPTGSSMQIAVTLRPDERSNPHGVPGHSHVVRDSLEP